VTTALIYFPNTDDFPVQASWLDAVDFCNKLSKREGLNPNYVREESTVTIAGGTGYRLPTEAEWEMACRAGSKTIYSFGNDLNQLGDFAWYSGNSGRRPHPVGTRKSNDLGLFDVHGNYGEWCWDLYDEKYYRKALFVDPRGPEGNPGTGRVIRGGDYTHVAEFQRSAHRQGCWADKSEEGIGFRVARTSP
jgi:formylglycine-generating enzyme required for sulfatase activity